MQLKECRNFAASGVSQTPICSIHERSLVKYNLPNGYEWCINHVFHALYALLDMNDKEKMLSEKTLMCV